MEISILHPHDVTDESIGQLNHLLKQLSADSSGTSRHALETLVEEGGFILCARTVSGEIIGMAQLDRRYNIEGVRVGTIESVVVDEAYRGQGIAQSCFVRFPVHGMLRQRRPIQSFQHAHLQCYTDDQAEPFQ